jgi:hypothetical protein
MPADGLALADTARVSVKPAWMKQEPTFNPPRRTEPTTPEKGGAAQSSSIVDTL